MVTLNTDGLDRLQANLKKLEERKQVPLLELMPDDFISRHSKFNSLQELIDASGIEENEEIMSQKFSDFVGANTDFADWSEMQKAAGGEYAKKILET